MKDRISTPGKEGRVKLTQDDGTIIEGKLEMADDPIEPGTDLAKGNLLDDFTSISIWGDNSDKTINQTLSALRSIAISDQSIVAVKVATADGAPIPGVTVSFTGKPSVVTDVKTDKLGYAFLQSGLGTKTVYLVYPFGYTGPESAKVTIVQKNETYQVSVNNAVYDPDAVLTIEESGDYDLPDDVDLIDLFVVGGGGSGGVVLTVGITENAANGGAGGYTKTYKAVPVINKKINVKIGAGGIGPTVTSNVGSYKLNGQSGGTTTVTIDGKSYSADPGEGGQAGYPDTYAGSHGGSGSAPSESPTAGNGFSDGKGSTSQGYTTKAFGESDGDPYSGAGGGALLWYSYGNRDFVPSYGSPGERGGGSGSAITQQLTQNVHGNNGTFYGSGGGALIAVQYQSYKASSGNGHSGVVLIRRSKQA